MSPTFKPRSYLVPGSEMELSELLKEFGDRARIVSGGTGIYEIAHRGLLNEVEALVDIRNLGLSYVNLESDSAKIGAATTMSTLLRSEELWKKKELLGILDSLKAIQPVQVKNVATIGGAICTALPFFDLPVALMSVGASVNIGPGNTRTKLLTNFQKGYFSIDLEAGDFVREIQIPIGRERSASAFQKFAITHDDWALVNCGACLSLDTNGIIGESSIVFGGGVGETPKRAHNIEERLRGVQANDEPRITEIFDSKISEDIETVSDIRASSEYRLHLSKVIGRRTLLDAVKRI